MEQKILTAEPRTQLKKGSARRLRRDGKIPVEMYGHSGNRSFFVDAHDFQSKFRTVSENTIIDLTVGNKSYDVLVKDYQEDLLTGSILHIDFFEVEAGKALRTNIPIRLVGVPEGVREGGLLEQLLHALEVECLPKDIPEQISVEVTELIIGDSLHVSDLSIPPDVRVVVAADQVVLAITTPKVEVEEVEVEEEEEGLEVEDGEVAEEGEAESEE